MHYFSDNKGRKWGLELNGHTIRKVKEDCGVYLTDLLNADGESESLKDSLLIRLCSPPYVLLIEVVWSLCESQANDSGISPDEFAAGMGGSSIENAMEALTATVADFFSSPRQRAGLTTLMAKTRQMSEVIETAAVKVVEAIDPSSVESSITDFSSNHAECAELNQTGAS